MTDKIIAAAREAGQYADAEYQRAWDAGEGASWQQIRDARFYAIAYRQGLQDAAKLLETKKEWKGGKWVSTLSPETASAIANTIRALMKENTHG